MRKGTLESIIRSNLRAKVTLGKWHGDCYKKGDRYIRVNFAEKIRQLKILGSYPVTVMYRVTAIYSAIIYRVDCILTLQVYVFHVVRLHISKIVINYMYKVIYMVLILPDKRQNRYKFLS